MWLVDLSEALRKLPQNNVEQLMEVEVDPESSHVAAISYQVSTKKSDEFIYRYFTDALALIIILSQILQ